MKRAKVVERIGERGWDDHPHFGGSVLANGPLIRDRRGIIGPHLNRAHPSHFAT